MSRLSVRLVQLRMEEYVQTVTAAHPAKPPQRNMIGMVRGARTVFCGVGTGVGVALVDVMMAVLEDDSVNEVHLLFHYCQRVKVGDEDLNLAHRPGLSIKGGVRS
jgi:hypothetical protein